MLSSLSNSIEHVLFHVAVEHCREINETCHENRFVCLDLFSLNQECCVRHEHVDEIVLELSEKRDGVWLRLIWFNGDRTFNNDFEVGRSLVIDGEESWPTTWKLERLIETFQSLQT